MALKIYPATDHNTLMDFLKFPYQLYRDDPYWVAPLIREQKEWIVDQNTPLFRNNPHIFFICQADQETVGRIAVVNDQQLAARKKGDCGFFTFLESISDKQIFQSLFQAAEKWTLAQGLNVLQGPVSPTKGDDFRGMLIKGFDSRPVLMDSYNPRYYPEQMDCLGYRKAMDLYAYYYDLTELDFERRMRAVRYAQRRYNFQIDRFNPKKIQSETQDIKTVLDKAMPDWPNMVPPSLEEVHAMAQRLKKYADPDFVLIARNKQHKPIGFNVALPDYNAVLAHLNGRLGPLSILKYLHYKDKIKGGRSFVMFVIPEYRKKGVAQALYLTALRNGYQKGYTYAEGSTIGEENITMRRDAEKLGGIHYKTYRIYEKQLPEFSG